MARRKKQLLESLDYHEGMSPNQVKIVLREFGLDKRIDEFNEWMYGQTCPLLERRDRNGKLVTVGGIYEYDLFRWIEAIKKTGIEPVWD